MAGINALWEKIGRLSHHRFRDFLILVTVLKLVLAGLFTSDYETKMFVPFVLAFLEQGFSMNPYDAFYATAGMVAFPYPPLMLAIESVGGLLVQLSGTAIDSFCSRLLFKLPLLGFDYLALYFLMRLYPNHRHYVGILYFASPILIFATYMHGQLDIIPTAFLLGAIHNLFARQDAKDLRFPLYLTAALLTKLHILAAVPLVIFYLLKQEKIRRLTFSIGIVTVVGLVVILPLSSVAFWHSVLFNYQQSLLTKVYLSFVDAHLYLPIFAVFAVYIGAYRVRAMNQDLFISFCGLLFGVFLALIPPGAGWYVWIVPFLTTFFCSVADNKDKNLYLYAALNFFYLLYFITAHRNENVDIYFMNIDMSWLRVSNEVYCNIVFTLLVLVLISLILSLYHYGIVSNAFYRRMGSPFTIGIAGDSGTGKSTLLAILHRCLGTQSILLIEGDGDHKWERSAPMWNVFTHLNPKANFLYRQARDIALLKKGNAVRRVEYDHVTGHFTEEHRIMPQKYILLSGLHAFYLPQMRRVLDLKIYMDTDEALRRHWKLQRDSGKRGYVVEEVIAQIEERMVDTKKYIVPQRQFADLVISYFDEKLQQGGDYTDLGYQETLSLRFTLSSAIDIEPAMEALRLAGVKMAYDFTKSLKEQTVVFFGASLNKLIIPFQAIANEVIPHRDELTREDMDHLKNTEGLIQLMILMVLSHKMRMAE